MVKRTEQLSIWNILFDEIALSTWCGDMVISELTKFKEPDERFRQWIIREEDYFFYDKESKGQTLD